MGRGKKLYIGLFIAYSALMLQLLLLRRPSTMKWNLVPFRTIRLYLQCFRPPLRAWLVKDAIINLAGNVVMFLPLGLLPPLICPKLRRLHRTFLFAALVITAVEVSQMLLRVGTCDIDDLILNLLGTMLGYGLFRLTSFSK